MKVVQINTFPYKATGSIMMSIHKMLLENGQDSYVVWGRGRKPINDREITIQDDIGIKFHGLYTRITDKTGFASWNATKHLIAKLDTIKPDIIHLHNLHGYYINLNILFSYIKANHIKVVWTLHDCWAFTGHCAFFDMVGCQKWKTGCNHCEQKETYPASKFCDSSRWNWEKKRNLFQGLDAELVTPSKWLADIVSQSFLKKYPIRIIYNGIDLNRYYRRINSNILTKYHLDNRPIVLGVASEWTERKGLKDIVELSNRMSGIQFVVVGLSNKQLLSLPKSIIGIKRTESVDELCDLYSASTVFFNPTYEDNFPTTNIEALACGTPIVTYDTGGSSEIITQFSNYEKKGLGRIIEKKDNKTVDYLVVEKSIQELVVMAKENRKEIVNNCCTAARYYEKNARLSEYADVYNSLMI